MNIGTIVTLRLPRRNRSVHVARNVHDVGRLRHIGFRGLFNHALRLCNSRAVHRRLVQLDPDFQG